MLRQLCDAAPVRPVLFPPFEDRAAWTALPSTARWQEAGEQALREAAEPPALPLSFWTDYCTCGKRVRYEKRYFQRRRTLCALAMAECATGTGRYLPAVADYAWAICEETAWQVPAHNRRTQQEPVGPLPLDDPRVLDLFAPETGATLAMVCAVLGGPLERYLPGLPERLAQTVKTRILRPYLEQSFWWMGGEGEPLNNWTTWCTQGVLIAAAALLPAGELPPVLHRAAGSLDRFLAAYGEDGCCCEGAQYYRRAASYLFNCVSILEKMLPGRFDGFWKEPKIKNIAEYIVNVHVDGPYYLNFADCSPLAGRRDVQDYLFAKKIASRPLEALALNDLNAALGSGDPDRLHDRDVCEGTNLYFHLQMAFTEREIRRRGPQPPVPPQDSWYSSVGMLVCRRGPYLLGAKAGANNDSHNHNDTGSVTLYKNGVPLLVDIGVERYTSKTFSPRRYEIWTMQSSWHNLPEFDPDGDAWQQLPGADAKAREVVVNPEMDGLSMDLAAAYGPVPGLGVYRRTVRLTEAGLTLLDETDYPGTVALSLLTEQPPAVQGEEILFGALARAAVTGAQRVVTQRVEITDERLRWSWKDALYRTRLYFTGALHIQLQ